MIKISVIIPVYNVEAYLEKCLESVVCQTLRDIEIICVNDGSSDNSLDILQKFAAKDERIKIINQENQGVSMARNNGIKESQGKYISFIDSDDWIDINFLEKLYNTAEKFEADIVSGGIIRHTFNGKEKKFISFNKIKIAKSVSDSFKMFYIPKRNYVINKIYLKSLITNNHIYFPEGKYYEDIIWSPQIVSKARLCVAVPDTYYHYRINPLSITNTTTGNTKKEADCRDAIDFSYNFIKQNKINIFWCREKYIFNFFGIPIFQVKQNDTYKYLYFLGIKIFSIKHIKV